MTGAPPHKRRGSSNNVAHKSTSVTKSKTTGDHVISKKTSSKSNTANSKSTLSLKNSSKTVTDKRNSFPPGKVIPSTSRQSPANSDQQASTSKQDPILSAIGHSVVLNDKKERQSTASSIEDPGSNITKEPVLTKSPEQGPNTDISKEPESTKLQGQEGQSIGVSPDPINLLDSFENDTAKEKHTTKQQITTKIELVQNTDLQARIGNDKTVTSVLAERTSISNAPKTPLTKIPPATEQPDSKSSNVIAEEAKTKPGVIPTDSNQTDKIGNLLVSSEPAVPDETAATTTTQDNVNQTKQTLTESDNISQQRDQLNGKVKDAQIEKKTDSVAPQSKNTQNGKTGTDMASGLPGSTTVKKGGVQTSPKPTSVPEATKIISDKTLKILPHPPEGTIPGQKKPPIHPIEELLGDKVIKNNGESTSPRVFAREEGVIGLYFSAHWCPPCRMFTPLLADTYNEAKTQTKHFELIFISFDSSSEGFDVYFASMPWWAVGFDDEEKREDIAHNFGVRGIPQLLFLDALTLELISPNGRQLVMMDPKLDYFPWKNLDGLDIAPQAVPSKAPAVEKPSQSRNGDGKEG